MAVAAVADDVHDHVTAKRGAVFRGKFADAHDGVGVFRVDMEDGHGLAFGNVRGKARGMFLDRLGGEADEIIHDDVNGAAHGIGAQVREVERFRPDALSRKCRVAMHDDGNNFVQSFSRTIYIASAQAVARLLCARPANSHGIDRFQMAWIRNEVDADFLAVSGDVGSGGADVIFHVAGAQDAARIDVFKASDDFMRHLARRVNHDVEAPAMAHGHDGRLGAVFAGLVENRIKQRDQRGDAFE